jgi:hypothetical protein
VLEVAVVVRMVDVIALVVRAVVTVPMIVVHVRRGIYVPTLMMLRLRLGLRLWPGRGRRRYVPLIRARRVLRRRVLGRSFRKQRKSRNENQNSRKKQSWLHSLLLKYSNVHTKGLACWCDVWEGNSGYKANLVDRAVKDRGDLAHLLRENRKFFGEDRLHAIGESFVRLMMNFN